MISLYDFSPPTALVNNLKVISCNTVGVCTCRARVALEQTKVENQRPVGPVHSATCIEVDVMISLSEALNHRIQLLTDIASSSFSDRMTTAPIAYKRSGLNVLLPEASHAQRQLAKETHGRWIGPFPISGFLHFLPRPDRYRTPPYDIFHGIPKDQPEADMYPQLIEALKSLNLKNLRFVNTSLGPDDKAPHYKKWKPGVSTYSSDFKFEDQSDSSTTRKGKPPSPTHFSELLLPFELKQGSHDPFYDKPDGPNAQFESEHVETQGQIAAILNEMFSYSFRTHAFSVYMDGHIARLFRADRSGILVSETFDYRRDAMYLITFLHGFDKMTPSQRGIDITFDRDFGEFQVPIFSYALQNRRFKLGDFLPHTESLVSRGRRIFRVYDQTSNRYLYMKDGWRAELPGMTAEWNIVAELKKNEVPHIPKILVGGDLIETGNYTIAHNYADIWWRVGPKTKLIPRIHYRFIEESAGRPLKEFANAKQLTQVLADVIEALRAAWVRCRYLHRDVSSANIMITPEGRGVLIDWEFAKQVPLEGEEPQKYTRACDRSGTRAYMSAALLRDPAKCHSPLDDLQSVYWVAFENALNNLNHNYDDLWRAAECLTDCRSLSKRGGDSRISFLDDAPFIEFVGNPAFSCLMRDFCQMMGHANRWEVSLAQDKDPTLQLWCVPDHDSILERFRGALRCPDDHWSPERDNRHRLWEAVEQIELMTLGSPTSGRFLES